MMNKTILCAALSSISMLTAVGIEAALPAKAVLDFDAGVAGGNYGFILSGSYFAMDNDGNGSFSKNERTGLAQLGGLKLNTTQFDASIDSPWIFFSNSGIHQSTSNTTVSNAVGNTADIDFSGWEVFWNDTHINMGSGASNGVASIVCDVDCAVGDGYTLDYFATVPDDGSTNFGNVSYTIHFEGTIASDPNLPPVATLDPLVVGVFPNASVDINLAGNVSDPDGDGVDNTSFQITYTGVARTPVPTIVDDGSGLITYTDNDGTDAVAPDTFTYTVTDSLGKVSASFLVEVNVATIIAPIANPFSVDTDENIAGTADVVANSVVGSAGIDATSVTVSNLVNLQSAVADVVTGIVSYTPTVNFTGTASFDYSVDDSDGVMSNVATVTINVNAAPVANDDAAEVDRNSFVVIDVLANDTDSDGTIDEATVVATGGASGTTTVDAAGLVTYTPTPNTGSLAPDSFTYTVEDNKGLISNTATVTITVNNAIPVAVNDVDSIDIETNTTVSVDVVANDTDSDGTIDAGFIVVTGSVDGTAVVNAGKVDFTPDNGIIGSASFTYTVEDNDGAVSNEANVIVSVSSGIGILPADAVLSVTPSSIAAEDVNKLPPVGSGSWFTMEVNPGVLTYTSLAGFNGITLGVPQSATAGNPNIDNPWGFFGNLGVSQTTIGLTILSDDKTGNVTIDQSGWDISWNDIPNIALNARAHTAGFSDGVSQLTCANDCSIGDTFILEYSATVPDGDVSGFGNVKYFLHIEGTIFAEGTTFTVGGCDVGAMNVVDDSRAVDSNCQVVTVVAGATADTVGNTTGVGLTAEEVGLKDPKLNTEDGKQCIGGCVDFVIESVAPGGFVDLVFKLSEPMPSGSVYRKLLNEVWVDFDLAFGDKIGSAASVDTGGDCLGPEDEYQSGLREGSDCLFMRITDNGPNDADPTEGRIVDPSGILVAGSPNTPAGSSSGCSISPVPVSLRDRADWMIVAAFLALMGALKYRRKNNL